MSFIFSRHLCYLRNNLMIGAEIRRLRIHSGKSLLDRYNVYPLMLTISTEATNRQPLIGMPLSFNSHANFTSDSKEKAESVKCKECQKRDKNDLKLKIMVLKLRKQKTLEICRGTYMLDIEKEKMIKMSIRKLCEEWKMKLQIAISVPRIKEEVKKLVERLKGR